MYVNLLCHVMAVESLLFSPCVCVRVFLHVCARALTGSLPIATLSVSSAGRIPGWYVQLPTPLCLQCDLVYLVALPTDGRPSEAELQKLVIDPNNALHFRGVA